MAGVYAVVCDVTERFYIGGTVSFWDRWQTHVDQLEMGNHGCQPLQEDWHRYGGEAFSLQILEEMVVDRTVPPFGIRIGDVLPREMFWQKQYRDHPGFSNSTWHGPSDYESEISVSARMTPAAKAACQLWAKERGISLSLLLREIVVQALKTHRGFAPTPPPEPVPEAVVSDRLAYQMTEAKALIANWKGEVERAEEEFVLADLPTMLNNLAYWAQSARSAEIALRNREAALIKRLAILEAQLEKLRQPE